MTKRVWVAISGVRYADGEGEDVEMAAAGEYFEKDGISYVRYDEDEGTDTVRSMIKLRPDCMEIVKKGAVNTTMIFQQGKNTLASYMTPAGELFMEIRTGRLEVYKDNGTLEAETEYSLMINGQHVSDNRIAVRVSAAG